MNTMLMMVAHSQLSAYENGCINYVQQIVSGLAFTLFEFSLSVLLIGIHGRGLRYW
jgi:hypothetical protein